MKHLFYVLVPVMMLLVACNNETEKKEECCKDKEKEKTEKTCENSEKACKQDAMPVDELMQNLEKYADTEVSVCGVCTHICDHSGRKIFVNSPENEDVLIIGVAPETMDKFNKDFEGQTVVLKGKLLAVENEDDVEVHHDTEMTYYIEATEVTACGVAKGHKHGEHKCKGDHDHDEDHERHDQEDGHEHHDAE